MKCPRCQSNTLRVVPDRRQSPVEVCGSCGGIWVPGGDVSNIGKTEVMYSMVARKAETKDQSAGVCPRGHGLLERARAELDPPVMLDRCCACHGIWFDRGEWEILSRSHLIDQIDNLWSASFRQSQRRERVRGQYLRRIEERIGSELFVSLAEVAEQLKDHPHRSEALAYLREVSSDAW